MKNRISIILVPFILSSLFLFLVFVSADSVPSTIISRFPQITFKDSLTSDEKAYLGISQKKTFSLSDIRATLVIVELFSTYCTNCPKNIPVLNHVYESVGTDQKLKDRVKIVSIGVGNTNNEIMEYTKKHKILYPVLPDYSFAVHKALGNPRVPYTLFVKKGSKGTNEIIYDHQGVLESEDFLLKRIKKML